MRTSKDIGFFRKLILKGLTKLQEKTIKKNLRSYMFFTALHFKLFYKKDLVIEAVNNSEEFKKAAQRHGNMVMVLSLKITPQGRYRNDNFLYNNVKVYNKVKQVFRSNLILLAKI